jgi:hypothetical protein
LANYDGEAQASLYFTQQNEGKTTQRITYNMALVFPVAPAVGQRYPVNPGTAGVSQWQWTGTCWNAVISTISLGATNQDAFNAYEWPNTDGSLGYQLTTDGAGNLNWAVTGTGNLVALGINAGTPFDGLTVSFPLVLLGTATPFTPNPSTNIVVFLGGVPQTPFNSYTISGATIIFTAAPLAGTTFYAVSSVVV